MSTKTPGGGGAGLVVGGVAVAATLACLLIWIPVTIAEAPGYSGSLNVYATAAAVARGQVIWTSGCTFIAAIEAVVLVGVVAVVWWLVARHHRKTRGVDSAARHMANRGDLAKLAPKGVAESAKRLRPHLSDLDDPDNPDHHGVLIGHTVRGNIALRQNWEDCAVDIWGPRKGKTTARAIPAIVAAPGPVIVTSRKGDIVDATRGVQEGRSKSSRAWVFDPMSMMDYDQEFWWNPLAGIKTITDARRFAAHFTFSGSGQRDEYFGPKADDLTANLILAAAVSGRDLTEVYLWSTQPRETKPAEILDKHGFALPAASIFGVINLPDKTRGGIYGGAEKALQCLTEPATTAWVTAPTRSLPCFDPAAFVRSLDTLYLLSESSPGSPAPVIAAFVDSVYRAGEIAARTMQGRRLDPPCLSILDEVCNICKIKELPNLYSYYGSLGMPIVSILQSFSQGVGVWGREGMQALWSAANVRVLGGGVSDPEFLRHQSDLIGVFDESMRSVTTNSNSWSRSINHSLRERPILRPSQLTALPDGRAVLMPSGSKPVLVKTKGWWQTRHADAITASLAKWDPDSRAESARPEPTDPDPAAASAFDEQWPH